MPHSFQSTTATSAWGRRPSASRLSLTPAAASERRRVLSLRVRPALPPLWPRAEASRCSGPPPTGALIVLPTPPQPTPNRNQPPARPPPQPLGPLGQVRLVQRGVPHAQQIRRDQVINLQGDNQCLIKVWGWGWRVGCWFWATQNRPQLKSYLQRPPNHHRPLSPKGQRHGVCHPVRHRLPLRLHQCRPADVGRAARERAG